jgi:hypothetical protein
MILNLYMISADNASGNSSRIKLRVGGARYFQSESSRMLEKKELKGKSVVCILCCRGLEVNLEQDAAARGLHREGGEFSIDRKPLLMVDNCCPVRLPENLDRMEGRKQEAGIRSQESRDRSQETEVRRQEAGGRFLILYSSGLCQLTLVS